MNKSTQLNHYNVSYNKEERMELINWAKNRSAEQYYEYFEEFEQMFTGKYPSAMSIIF